MTTKEEKLTKRQRDVLSAIPDWSAAHEVWERLAVDTGKSRQRWGILTWCAEQGLTIEHFDDGQGAGSAQEASRRAA